MVLAPGRRARRHGLAHLCTGGRSIEVHQVLGEGPVLAILFMVGDSTHSTRGSVVLTFSGEQLVNERTYCDWAKAVPRDLWSERIMVGSAAWRMHGT